MPQVRTTSLNSKQVRGSSDFLFTEEVSIIELTPAQINANSVDIGIARVAGCYIHKAFLKVNGNDVYGGIAAVRPDSNAATCVVRCTNFNQVCDVTVMPPDLLIVRTLWKKGNNPQGVQINTEIALELPSEVA
jgi:hypothetical protein